MPREQEHYRRPSRATSQEMTTLDLDTERELNEIFAYLESFEFDHEMSVSSGVSLCRLICEANCHFQRLCQVARGNTLIQAKITQQIQVLTRRPDNITFLASSDTALFSLGYALQVVESPMLSEAVQAIARKPNLLYARGLIPLAFAG